jgi:hypothetical protein
MHYSQIKKIIDISVENKYKIQNIKYENMKEIESGSEKRRMGYILYNHCIKQYCITLFYREIMSSDQETLK